MFALATAFAALVASAVAIPAPQSVSVSSGGPSSSSISVPGGSSISSLSGSSFDNWGGLSQLQGFDSFYGSNNYCGNNNQQTVIQQSVVCQTEDITVLQQQFSILQEFAKRILLEKVCEVETQTIIWSQYVSSLQSFTEDFSHRSGRSIGYDQVVAGYISDLVTSSDTIVTTNYNFQGIDIGQSLVCPTGYNWQSGVSQITVQQAQLSCNSAILSSQSSAVSSVSIGSSASFGGFSGFGQSAGTFAVGGSF